MAPIDETLPMTSRYSSVGAGIYQDTAGTYYHRPRIQGRRTWRRLASITAREAKREAAIVKSDHARAQLGLCLDPLVKAAPMLTVATVVERYVAAGCPDRHLKPRAGRALDAAVRDLGHISAKLGRAVPSELAVADCDRYHGSRTAELAGQRGPGHRTVELELCSLSNCLSWAARSGLIASNPLMHGRPTYRRSSDIVSCNSSMADTDEELHRLAAYLLSDARSRTLGFQLLLEALSGCRGNEVCRLRWDAQRRGVSADPGYLDDHSLWIHRSKHGCFPYVLLDIEPGCSPLRPLLASLRAWHDQEHPTSPWMLPGRSDQEPIDGSSLTHALARATAALGLPHRTSHGLRAFHVRLLRSRGIDDSEIAKRLGQRSGVALVERVYGRPEPGWFGGRHLDGLPASGKPAWDAWARPANVTVMPMAVIA